MLEFNHLEPYFQLLLLLYFLSALLLLYLWYQFNRVIGEEVGGSESDLAVKPVSIIIAFKNEEKHLTYLINSLLEQSHPEFEILLVNDHSTDRSVQLIELIQDHRIRLLHLPEELSGKKQAVQFGVEAAKSPILLFTDADCKPSSNKWISHMVGQLNPRVEIVLGYSPYQQQSGLLNALIRFEAFFTALQYGYFSLRNKAYMGIGRNMAYQKSLLDSQKQINRHEDILSGDDDLLINQIATKNNVGIQFHPDAHVLSEPKFKWSAYWQQKRRHLEAGTRYKPKDRLKLAIIGFAQLIFTLTFMALIFFKISLTLVFGSLLSIVFLRYLWSKKLGEILRMKGLVVWFPLMEMLYILWMLAVGCSTWIWKVDKWK